MKRLIAALFASVIGCSEVCGNDKDCSEGLICEDSRCVSETIENKVLGISQAVTKNGRVVFDDTEVYVGVDNATILYIDTPEAKVFLIDHPDYIPQLEIAAHNSSHEYSLTKTFQSIDYDSQKKERNSVAANEFTGWDNWEYQGCKDKKEVSALMEGGSWLFKKFSSIFGFGISDRTINEAKNYLQRQWKDDQVADAYLFNPSKHKFFGSSVIWVLDIRKRSEEIRNGIDDDCDGLVDNIQQECSDDCVEGCDLPACIQYGVYSCEYPCTFVSPRCIVPCASDSDCLFGEIQLKCSSLEDFSERGKGCLLPKYDPEKELFCPVNYTQKSIADYATTPSGAELLAITKDVDTCIPDCLQ